MTLLGVDIGGTKIAAGIVDSETGAVLHHDRTPTEAHEGGIAVLARAIALARTVAETANVSLDAVGIGAGGQIDYRTGVVLSATDILPGWAGTRLSDAFSGAFGVPAFADNDVNAFAQGEHRFGAGRTSSAGQGATDCVYLALGTGVGGAIFTAGKLHRGKRGTGGELGHMLIAPSKGGTLEENTCGARLATYFRMFSKDEAQQRAELRLAAGAPLSNVNGYDIGYAALNYEEAVTAVHAVRLVGHRLGFGLASLANILDTERIVIGGGLSDLGELLLAPTRETFAGHALPLYADTEIVQAKLGTNSSIVGAATVALTATAVSDKLLRGEERNTVA